MEQYFQQPLTQSEPSREDTDKWKSASAEAAGVGNNSSNAFDCNICLDFVQDPVVTFCGHLYCWPCIYEWIQSQCQRASSENAHQQSPCPVCKAEVSENTLIPLYGRGQTRKPTDNNGSKLGLVVPQRPIRPSCGVHTLIATASTSSRPNQLHYHGYPHQQVYPYYSLRDYPPSPAFGLAGTTTYHPMIDMFGGMIYARIFRNSQTTLYTYPNTYSVGATSSTRVRRHVMLVDRSLSRVCFFLFCCIILCLLLF